MIRPDAALPIERQSEAVLTRMCLWAEARGEGPIGMLAVRYVIGNRRVKTGKSTNDLILAPLQFSSFNKDDPNREKLMDAPHLEPEAWGMADAVCSLYEKVLTVDPTHGALNYYAPKVVNPKWGRGNPRWRETAEIGNHVFGVAG